jgi:membrane protein implicated in regulation of membrane protease activity
VAGWWWYLAAGAALFAADILLGLAWTHPARLRSDQPDLNRRLEQLAGRVLLVEEAIVGGRGKVRAGDTLWPAEGPDMPAGAAARVAAVRDGVLIVESAQI